MIAHNNQQYKQTWRTLVQTCRYSHGSMSGVCRSPQKGVLFRRRSSTHELQVYNISVKLSDRRVLVLPGGYQGVCNFFGRRACNSAAE